MGDERSQCFNATVSAHAFSPDGFYWHVSEAQPFTNQIETRREGIITFSTRERPFLFFNGDGQMTHLFTAVCSATQCPNDASCANCKYTHWDYTVVQPLDVSPTSVKPFLDWPATRCSSGAVGDCTQLLLRSLNEYQGTLLIL